ncbi:MAG: HAMP domain-containing sensor histidine kinase, partial [Polyangiaceae bacterium]
RRVVEPLEALRDEALAQSSVATRNVALSVRQTDEVGDLARALNELLNTLETKRRDNEAFVADLVHELKNPVAAVRATAESVTADLTPERAQRISRLLHESTSKIDRLITQFLELARAEAGMPNEIREPVDLVALLRGLVKSASEDERYKGIAFSFSSASDRALVSGVDHRFEASFRELIENGASFVREDGHVDVVLEIRAGIVVVEISDSGPGIAAENLPRVFDRFFTTRDRERGTGLGLALVKAVAEAHGGSVRASSEVGKGACFYVQLPLLVAVP